MDVVSGADVGEDVAWHLEFPPARHERLADFRVAILPLIDWLPVDAEISNSLEELVGCLRKAGATVREAKPGAFGDLRRHHELYSSILAARTSAETPEKDRRAPRREDAAGPRPLRRCAGPGSRGQRIRLHSLASGQGAVPQVLPRVLHGLGRASGAKQHHGGLPPPPTSRGRSGGWTSTARLCSTDFRLPYPAVATLSGQPSTAFPTGLTKAGLPIGLQAVGPYLEDKTTIRFAALVEREFAGFQPPPGYEQG